MGGRTAGELLGSRDSLRLATIGPVALACTVAQSAAGAVEHIDGTPRPCTAKTVLVVFGFACAVAAVPNAALGVAFSDGAPAVVWAVIIAVESFLILVGGVLAIRLRRESSRALTAWREQIAAVRREQASVAAALVTIAAIADEAFLHTQAGAQRAKDLLGRQAPTSEIERVLDIDVRAAARDASHLIDAVEPDITPKTPNTPLWRDVLGVKPQFAESFLVACLLGLPVIALLGNWLTAAIAQVLAMFVAWGSAVLLYSLLANRHPSTASIVALASGSLIGTVIVAGSWVGWSLASVALGLALMPTCLLAALAPSAWRAATMREREASQAMHDQLDSERSLLEQARAQLDEERTSLVAVLHTRVQGQATAAIVALELGLDDATVETILGALQQADSPSPGFHSSDPLSDVLRDWSTAFALTSDVDESLTIDERRRVARHVGEALHNSARHGHASKAHVLVTKDPSLGDVVITVTDDGGGPADSILPGLGTALARREGGTWDLQSLPAGGAILRVRLSAAS